MKKVFEAGLSRTRGRLVKFKMDYRLAEWLERNLPWDVPVRITIENLPKPRTYCFSDSGPGKRCIYCSANCNIRRYEAHKDRDVLAMPQEEKQ